MSPELHFEKRKVERSPLEERSEIVKKAWNFAKNAHEGQKRHSGEPYFEGHSVEVYKIVTLEMGIEDEVLAAAALLHDVVEDTEVTIKEIEQKFGEKIAFLVNGVSKISTKKPEAKDINTDETNLKVLIYNSTPDELSKNVVRQAELDPRVIILKIADKLHNLRTVEYVTEKSRIQQAKEGFTYADLAKSQGYWIIKTELEDIAFKNTDPQGYKEISKEVEKDQRKDETFQAAMINQLNNILEGNEVEGRIEIRNNGIWNLKEKRATAALDAKSPPNSFSHISDLVSFRTIVKDELDAYKLMGLIHRRFNANNPSNQGNGISIDFSRYDEFIAEPRINGYRAIHIVLNTPYGAVEIALTTEKMEDFNNRGVAALMSAGQSDLSQFSMHYFFTPSGVIFLPKEARGIDIAYRIDPALGASATSIIADLKNYALTDIIDNAADIEVVANSPHVAPLDKKLEGIALPATRKIIEQQEMVEDRNEAIELGLFFLKEDLEKRGICDLRDIEDYVPIGWLSNKFSCRSINDLYYKVGAAFVTLEQVSDGLDALGLTKEKLDLSTIVVSAEDKPGILYTLIKWLSEPEAKYNIITTRHRKVDERNIDDATVTDIELRLVIKALDDGKRKEIMEKLSNDKRFASFTLV